MLNVESRRAGYDYVPGVWPERWDAERGIERRLLAGWREGARLATERQITPLGVDQISSGELPAGTVLLSSRAPIGYLAVAEIPVSVNQGIIAILTGDIPNLY